MNRMKS